MSAAASSKKKKSVRSTHLYLELQQYPSLHIKQLLHLLSNSRSQAERSELEAKISQIINDNEMGPFAASLDGFSASHLSSINESKIADFDEQISKAADGFGQGDIVELMLSKAIYLCKIGSKDASILALRQLEEKCPTTGARLDFAFAMIRIGLLWDDLDVVKRNIAKAESLMELGGDWDRRNRLKVYQALFCVHQRKFKEAANLLVASISTFNYTELMDLKTFMALTIVTSLMTLSRSDIKQKICNSPEILESLQQLPELKRYVQVYHESRYRDFFGTLASFLEPFLRSDVLLAPHASFIIKEMRIRIYAQVLQSYKCVTLVALANAFGVSVEFIDQELFRWISAGRINCMIDKVSGTVFNLGKETSKNEQYAMLLKNGDLLLNKVQRLSRVVNI